MHGVSAGEVSSLAMLARIARSTYTVLITTSTKSGKEIADKLYKNDIVLYFPFDYPPVVFYFLKLVKPKAICFAEAEFWPFFLLFAKKMQIPTFLINGHIDSKVIKSYHILKPFFKRVFSYHKLLFVQTSDDYNKLRSMGVNRTKLKLIGNLKFDFIENSISQDLLAMFSMLSRRIVIIAASTHKGEEELILRVFKRLYKAYPNLLLIIAPRHIDRIRTLKKAISPFKYIMLSELTSSNKVELLNKDILLVDTMGDLFTLYKVCDIAILGGSFINGIGGHNPIEAMYFGKPLVVGPFSYNIDFIVKDFSLNRAMLLCKNAEENCLFYHTERLIRSSFLRRYIGHNASNKVRQSMGSSKKTFDVIKSFL